MQEYRFRNRALAVVLGAVTVAAATAAAFAQVPGNGPAAAPPAVSQPAGSPPAPASALAPQPIAAPDGPISATSVATPPAASGPTVAVANVTLPHDLSPWGMFLNADIVVKFVMIGLIFASLVTWTVCVAKYLELWGATRAARAALPMLNEARSLAEANARLGGGSEPVARLARTAMREVEMSANADVDGLKERVSWLLERVEVSAGRRIGRGIGLLATIGATAPFVGLFGTVWGIMNSFIGISNAHTTNLAVVAPGIAEALLATALGLFAAIPAVVIYNVFSRSIGGYRALLADGSALVMRLVSRDCDRAASPSSHMSRAAE